MFHHARDVHILAVRDRIDLQLLAHDVLVHQDRCIMADLLDRRGHVDLQLLVVVHDLHRTSA